jgi:hypothetical protein
MDLSALNPKKKANAGAFLHLVNPGTGLPLYEYDDSISDPIERDKTKKAVGLWLMGRDSDLYAKTRHKNVNTALTGKKKSDPKTSEMIEQETVALLADMTTGWDNLSYNGQHEFSRDAVIGIYTDLAWVREQADTFISDRANFI